MSVPFPILSPPLVMHSLNPLQIEVPNSIRFAVAQWLTGLLKSHSCTIILWRESTTNIVSCRFPRCLRHHSREIGAREFALAKQVDLGEKNKKDVRVCYGLLSLPLKWYPMVSSMIHNFSIHNPMIQCNKSKGLIRASHLVIPAAFHQGCRTFFPSQIRQDPSPDLLSSEESYISGRNQELSSQRN